ncbi:MAG TPA: hypothetical protein VK739_05250, partial [bacterium]|nr:hypothetical protein [bacterium]
QAVPSRLAPARLRQVHLTFHGFSTVESLNRHVIGSVTAVLAGRLWFGWGAGNQFDDAQY